MKKGDHVYTSSGIDWSEWRRVVIVFVEDDCDRPWAYYEWDGGCGSNYISELRPVSPLILLAECAE